MAIRKTPKDESVLEDFGAVMRQYRKSRGMDLQDLADKLEVTYQTLIAWEAGVTGPPLARAIAWCELVGVDLWPHEPGGL